MGSGAASSKAKELYNAGYNGWQVGLGAFASGAIEWLTEKYSVEYFTSHILNGDIGTLRQLAMNVAARILSQYGSSRSKTETAKRLQVLADYIVGEEEPNYKEIQGLTRDAAGCAVHAGNHEDSGG